MDTLDFQREPRVFFLYRENKEKRSERKCLYEKRCFEGYCMLGCNRGYLDGSFFSEEISLENFVVCRVQTMEIKNDTGYGRAAELRDAAQVQKALDALGEIEVRKMMPWEKFFSDRQEQEPYYTMMIWYDSETEGRYESLACWEGGRIDFRDTAYMVTGKEKTKATDLLEGLLQEYETAE